MKPKVSVIIPTFNREHVLQRAVESVLEQDFKDFELLIIDDGSTDKTIDLVNKIKGNHLNGHKIKYIKTDNFGVSAARNLGIKYSSGKWISFLDSDDEWLSNKLSLQITLLKDQKHNWCHGEEIWIRNGKRVNSKNKHQKAGGDQFIRSLKLCLISPSTVLIKKEIFDEIGLFREDFPVCEDYDLWLRISSIYKIAFVKEPIIKKFGGHEDQLSQKFKAMDYWRVKSMFGLLKENRLAIEKKKVITEEISYKCNILLNGYKKHNNLKQFDEVQKIKDQVNNENIH